MECSVQGMYDENTQCPHYHRIQVSLEFSQLTMKEAVIFVAASAEQRVEGVHSLIAWDGLGVGAVYVGRTLRWDAVRLRQVLVPVYKKSSNHQNSITQ